MQLRLALSLHALPQQEPWRHELVLLGVNRCYCFRQSLVFVHAGPQVERCSQTRTSQQVQRIVLSIASDRPSHQRRSQMTNLLMMETCPWLERQFLEPAAALPLIRLRKKQRALLQQELLFSLSSPLRALVTPHRQKRIWNGSNSAPALVWRG